MRRFRYLYFFTFVFLTAHFLQAQPVEKITLKKDLSLIFFFQKGTKSDTVIKNKSDLFYLLVPDSLKSAISVYVENGRLQPVKNDSLVRLELIKGLNYECIYTSDDPAELPAKNNKPEAKKLLLKSQVNGTAAEPGNRIQLKIVNRKKNETVLENRFYYKN